MRVEIVDISHKSAFFEDKLRFVGKTGTIATSKLMKDGFISGKFYSDDEDYNVFFYGVKTKPIFDA